MDLRSFWNHKAETAPAEKPEDIYRVEIQGSGDDTRARVLLGGRVIGRWKKNTYESANPFNIARIFFWKKAPGCYVRLNINETYEGVRTAMRTDIGNSQALHFWRGEPVLATYAYMD
jgi:hypothetical protein